MMLTLMQFTRLGRIMQGIVRWKGGECLEGETEGGIRVPIHTEDSPNPVQMVLLAHGACSMIDVVIGLKDRMTVVRDAWVELDSTRRDEPPRRFTSVTMHYVIEGDVPEKLVRRIIEQSHAKLCSVGAMVIGAGASLDWTLEIRP